MKKIGIFKDLGYVFVVIYTSLSLILIIFHNLLKNISICIPDLIIFIIFFTLLIHIIYSYFAYFKPMLQSGEFREKYEKSLKGIIPYKLYEMYGKAIVIICTVIAGAFSIFGGMNTIDCFIRGKELTHNTKKCISLIEMKYSVEGRQNAKVGRY